MSTHISLWQLSHKLKTYSDLLRFLCQFYDVPTEIRGRGMAVTNEDAVRLEGLLWAWRARPKVSRFIVRKARRKRRLPPRPKPLRVARVF
jgi:hypothetical protein